MSRVEIYTRVVGSWIVRSVLGWTVVALLRFDLLGGGRPCRARRVIRLSLKYFVHNPAALIADKISDYLHTTAMPCSSLHQSSLQMEHILLGIQRRPCSEIFFDLLHERFRRVYTQSLTGSFLRPR